MDRPLDAESGFAALLTVVGTCQRLAGEAIDWVTPPSPAGLASRFGAATAGSPLESVAIYMVLEQFTERLGLEIHRNFHGRGRSFACPFVSHVSLARGFQASPSELMADWTIRYTAGFERAHRSVSERVKLHLDANPLTAVPAATLARSVGCSRSVLARRFAAESGESILQYRTRVRTLAALRLLADTNLKIDAIARDVGWKSRKDMYRAFDRLLGLTPAALRLLPRSELEPLATLLSGPGIHMTKLPYRSSGLSHLGARPSDGERFYSPARRRA